MLIAATFAQPFLVNEMIGFVYAAQTESSSNNTGYGLLGAFALVYGSIAIITGRYWQCNVRFFTKARSLLVAAVYEKTVNLDSAGDMGELGTTTLMSADIEKIVTGFNCLHEMWANIVNVGIALYLLYLQLGYSFVAPLIAILLITAISVHIGALLKPKQERWMAGTQARVDLVSAVVHQIKGIKMLGLSGAITALVEKSRTKEVDLSTDYRQASIWVSVGCKPLSFGLP